MKRIGLWMLMLVIGLSLGKAQTEQDVKKVAILEVVDRTNEVPYGVKLLLRTSLAKAITITSGYEGYDRVDMAAIQGEQDFQRTGMVSDEQIKRLGEMTGAAYVLVAEVAKIDASHIIVTAKILNVESAKLERTDLEQTGISSQEMEKSCSNLANRLLNQSASSSKVFTDVNSNKNIKNSSEINVMQAKEEVVFKGFNLFLEDNNLHRKKMGRIEIQSYLGDDYKIYLKSIRNKKMGVAFSCVGGVLAVTGTLVFIVNYELGAGIPLWGAGAVCLGAGIPLWVRANKKILETIDGVEYQNMMGYQAKPVLSIESGKYGVGLSLRF